MHAKIIRQLAGGGAVAEMLKTADSRQVAADIGLSSQAKAGPCYSAHAGMGTESLHVFPGKGGAATSYRLSAEHHDEIMECEIASLPEPILIHTGHYIPNRMHPTHVPQNAIRSFEIAIEMAAKLYRLGKSFAFLVVINDITLSSEERSEIYGDFSLPKAYAEQLCAFEAERETSTMVILIGETKLAEKLNREKHRLVAAGKLVATGDGSYFVNGDASKTALFASAGSMAPRCIRAFARLAALPRELGFSSFFQVLPKCGSVNAHLGYDLGRRLFADVPDVPALLLYRTHMCW